MVFMSIFVVIESVAPLDPDASEHDRVFPSSSSLGSYSTDWTQEPNSFFLWDKLGLGTEMWLIIMWKHGTSQLSVQAISDFVRLWLTITLNKDKDVTKSEESQNPISTVTVADYLEMKKTVIKSINHRSFDMQCTYNPCNVPTCTPATAGSLGCCIRRRGSPRSRPSRSQVS